MRQTDEFWEAIALGLENGHIKPDDPILGRLAPHPDPIEAPESIVERGILEGLARTKREPKQTARDQNDVQSLANLRESTKKGFDQVADDVKSLLTQLQRLDERVGQADSKIEIVTGLAKVQENREGIDFRFNGVYNVTEDLEKRLQSVEERLAPPVNYLGYKVTSRGNILVVDGKEFFPFKDKISELQSESYGVLVTLKNGNKYLLAGRNCSRLEELQGPPIKLFADKTGNQQDILSVWDSEQ